MRDIVWGNAGQRTGRRGVIVFGVAVLAGLVLALSAAAAPRDSIRVVLAQHILVGQKTVIKLTGHASGTKPEVWLYAQPQKCPSTFAAELKFNNETIFIDGGHVKGHYTYKDPIAFSNTHGPLNFCAYLTSFSPDFSYINEAHDSLRFRIPS
jgi:hypothetical protein